MFKGIVPYLFCNDAETLMGWYGRVFGFVERGRWHNDAGQIQNAEMQVGDTEIWIDGSGRGAATPGKPNWIGIWVEDVDAIHKHILAAGVECEAPVEREFGVRMLNVADPEGNLWGFMRRTD